MAWPAPGPAVLDRDIAACRVTKLIEALQISLDEGCEGFRGLGIEKSNHGRPCLLPARRMGPRCRRTTQNTEKFPSPHVRPRSEAAGSCASNECFDRAENRLRYCNIRCWPMSESPLRAMMGWLNHDQRQLFYSFCLDEVAPDDHLVRASADRVTPITWRGPPRLEWTPLAPDERAACGSTRRLS